ncbi:MAG TPA: Holliday junction resolvase Hjc [archaeon]|nr:Holliday junction resolvase Hjc [archaeon]
MSKAKGSRAERELLHKFYENEWACARIAGSGSNPLPCPDLIAMKNKKALAIECKFHNGNYLNISRAQMNELSQWKAFSGSEIVIAWKIPFKGWFFLSPSQFKENSAAFSISKEKALIEGISLEKLVQSLQ